VQAGPLVLEPEQAAQLTQELVKSLRSGLEFGLECSLLSRLSAECGCWVTLLSRLG